MAKVAFRRNRWVLDYYENGKRHVETMPKNATQKEAKTALREIETAISKGNFLPVKKMPCFSDVCQEWLRHKQASLRASSLQSYTVYSEKHFKVFNDLKIDRITSVKIESFISDKQKEGFDVKTIKYLIGLLNQIFVYAIRHKYMEVNPVSVIERPRSQNTQKGKVLSPEEVKNLLDNIDDYQSYVLIMLAIFSGARQGELLGLKWADVNFTDGCIHINRTFNTGAIYEPKNTTSKRKIDLGKDMMLTLRDFRKSNMQHELLFSKDGKHLKSGSVLKCLRRALNKAGLPEIRFHDLRHTFASLMLLNGENVKVIQTQLGHSTPVQTLNTYSHLIKDSFSEVADRLENTVFKESGNKTVTKTG